MVHSFFGGCCGSEYGTKHLKRSTSNQKSHKKRNSSVWTKQCWKIRGRGCKYSTLRILTMIAHVFFSGVSVHLVWFLLPISIHLGVADFISKYSESQLFICGSISCILIKTDIARHCIASIVCFCTHYYSTQTQKYTINMWQIRDRRECLWVCESWVN